MVLIIKLANMLCVSESKNIHFLFLADYSSFPLMCNSLANWVTLKQQLDFVHDFVGQDFRKGLSEQFLLGGLHVVAVKCQLGLQSSEGSSGLDVQHGTHTGQTLMPAVVQKLSWD